jgi:hypothetical protein
MEIILWMATTERNRKMEAKIKTLMESAAMEFRRADLMHSLYYKQKNSSCEVVGTVGQDLVGLFLKNPCLALKRLETKLKGILHVAVAKRRGFELRKKHTGGSIPTTILDLSRNAAVFVKNIESLKQDVAQRLSNEEKVEFSFYYYGKV